MRVKYKSSCSACRHARAYEFKSLRHGEALECVHERSYHSIWMRSLQNVVRIQPARWKSHKRVFKTRCNVRAWPQHSWWGLMYTELLHFYVNVKSFLFSLPSFSMFISDLQDLPSPRGADTPTVEQCEDSRWASLALVVAVSFFGRNHSRFGCWAKRTSAQEEKRKKKAKPHRTCCNYVFTRFSAVSPYLASLPDFIKTTVWKS